MTSIKEAASRIERLENEVRAGREQIERLEAASRSRDQFRPLNCLETINHWWTRER